MFTFFLKKNVCDGWDNLFSILITNIFSIVLGVGGIFAAATVTAINQLLGVLVIAFCSGLFMIPIFAWGANARKIADFNTPSFSVFFRTMAVVWKTAFAYGAMISLAAVAVLVGLRYYMHMFADGNLFGLLLAAVLFWFMLISVFSLQWFIPFYFLQEENTFVKCLKKSFIVFFDNPLFSIAIFVHNVILFAFSIMLFFFVPGTSGITLACTNALRLRLYKYDWLEEMENKNPDFAKTRSRRVRVPWNELLAEDKELLGPRKLRSFLFPWK